MKYGIWLRVTVSAIALVLCLSGTPAQAGSARFVYTLHSAGQFSRATASATVYRASASEFTLQIVVRGLPPAETLHAKPARHAYVGWLINGKVMHGPMHMGAVGLHFDKKTGNYTGKGTVMVNGVTGVIVSAEPTIKAYMPVMPILTVLSS
jgi:hypothetical protein